MISAKQCFRINGRFYPFLPVFISRKWRILFLLFGTPPFKVCFILHRILFYTAHVIDMLAISVEQTYLLTVAVIAIVSLLLWRAFKNLKEKNRNLEVAINEKIILEENNPKEMTILEENNI